MSLRSSAFSITCKHETQTCAFFTSFITATLNKPGCELWFYQQGAHTNSSGVCLVSIYTLSRLIIQPQKHFSDTAKEYLDTRGFISGCQASSDFRLGCKGHSRCIASAWQETGSTAVCRCVQSQTGRDCGGAARRHHSQRRTAALVQTAAQQRCIRHS